jgi:hypothetical protein
MALFSPDCLIQVMAASLLIAIEKDEMLSLYRFVAGYPMTSNPLEKFERQFEPAWLRFARWAGYAVVVAIMVIFLIAALEYYVLSERAFLFRW